jgi:hypothetical protein
MVQFSMPECHQDDTPVALDADKLTVALKSNQEIHTALGFLDEMIREGKLTSACVITRSVAPSISCSGLPKSLGYDEDLKIVDRHDRGMIRRLNEEIHELHNRLGQNSPFEGIGERLHLMDKVIQDWWHDLGFSLADGRFIARYSGNACYQTKLSTFLDAHATTFSEEPVTEGQQRRNKIKELTDAGLQVHQEDREFNVLDNDSNRAWFREKLKAKFPSAEIVKVKSYSMHQDKYPGLYRMCDLKVWIRNIKDLCNDPEPRADVDAGSKPARRRKRGS